MSTGCESCEVGEFEFLAPTTCRNALRVLRAMQLPKPGFFYYFILFFLNFCVCARVCTLFHYFPFAHFLPVGAMEFFVLTF